jgi:nitrite reductase/ring-hydroxylating ferredoxin subunit
MSILDDTPGQARCEAVTVQSILHREAKEQNIPGHLLEESYEYLGSEDIPVERYISPEYAQLESEKMWSKTWQMVCREEDMPDVGDHVVYDIAHFSIIVMRSAPDKIQAYHNSCLHRGTQLRTENGSVPFLRCTFHGWQWNLDGSLKKIPAKWDFPHVDAEKFCLPRCQVGIWGGFVFINIDPDAKPLEEYLEVLPEHFRTWQLENRFKAVHVAKRVPCNWKVALEAFIESYHVTSTHPQLPFYDGDENTQYDIYGDNVNRMINLLGIASPTLGDLDEQTIAEQFAADMRLGDTEIEIPEGSTARDAIGDVMRSLMSAGSGVDMSAVSTSDIIDTIEYFLFPNFMPWAGFGIPIVYRFLPDGPDPNKSIMDVMLLAPFPEGTPRPPAAKVHWIEGDDWRQAPELGVLGLAYNQDMHNLSKLQKGLHASQKKTVTLANYQEIRIRHYHKTLEEYLRR